MFNPAFAAAWTSALIDAICIVAEASPQMCEFPATALSMGSFNETKLQLTIVDKATLAERPKDW